MKGWAGRRSFSKDCARNPWPYNWLSVRTSWWYSVLGTSYLSKTFKMHVEVGPQTREIWVDVHRPWPPSLEYELRQRGTHVDEIDTPYL